MEIIKQIITEISELNSIDGKTLTERGLKFNEEYGEFCAEVCKFVGITHKPYDKEHLREEMSDAMQNLFSIYLDICEKTGITMDEVFEMILVKNKKWREKAPLYTINIYPQIKS
jgi:NTP pyrophosphatase (non-canonical NTP hydrolase)